MAAATTQAMKTGSPTVEAGFFAPEALVGLAGSVGSTGLASSSMFSLVSGICSPSFDSCS